MVGVNSQLIALVVGALVDLLYDLREFRGDGAERRLAFIDESLLRARSTFVRAAGVAKRDGVRASRVENAQAFRFMAPRSERCGAPAIAASMNFAKTAREASSSLAELAVSASVRAMVSSAMAVRAP